MILNVIGIKLAIHNVLLRWQIKPLEEYMILHNLEVMYQKMEEHVRMWKPESKKPEELLLD
jgi:hypothetical protein